MHENPYKFVKELEKALEDPKNTGSVYKKAKQYCESCEYNLLNPMLRCANKCPVWEVKNKVVNLLENFNRGKN